MPSLSTSTVLAQSRATSASAQGSGATPSQLDIIAEINERAARQLWGRRVRRIAVAVGVALLLGVALWWAMYGGAVRAPVTLPPAAALLAETLRDTLTPAVQGTPAASAVAGQALPDVAAAPAQGALTASAPMQAAAVPLNEAAATDRRARKARTDAPQLQQERSRTQAQEREQREPEREAQQASEPADAASRREAEQAPVPAPSAAEIRPGVRELCSASGNILSRNFCHARECRKPEHANDAVCIRLRELEQARPGGSQ
jgi:hypothetical protein